MHRCITRRSLLRGSAAASAGFLILKNSASVWSFQANEKLGLAHIGVGGRGRDLLLTFCSLANPVLFCDVNESKATEMYRRFPDVPRFSDFRQAIQKMHRQIDGVVVATPDHTHAVASAWAIRAGKHVYTEKPLTRTVQESRALRELARRHRVATSMGNQGTASGQFRRALELIREGTIGQVREVHIWNDQGGAGHKQAPSGQAKIPPYLNWDLWLGPAQDRPFHPRWMAWHQWRDFGTSQLGNWASHTANLAFMALNVDLLWRGEGAGSGPIRVRATVEEVNRLSFPRWEIIRWEVPARGSFPPVVFHWYNGSLAPGARDRLEDLAGRELDWGDKGQKKWADFAGCLIVGTEGKIHSTAHNATFAILPEDRFRDVDKSRPRKLDQSMGHERDWLLACQGGKPAWANYDYAGPLNEFLQLGNVATQFEDVLEYDPATGRITNNQRADAALHCEYRQGWSL